MQADLAAPSPTPTAAPPPRHEQAVPGPPLPTLKRLGPGAAAFAADFAAARRAGGGLAATNAPAADVRRAGGPRHGPAAAAPSSANSAAAADARRTGVQRPPAIAGGGGGSPCQWHRDGTGSDSRRVRAATQILAESRSRLNRSQPGLARESLARCTVTLLNRRS